MMKPVDLAMLLFMASGFSLIILGAVFLRRRAPKPSSLGIIRSLPQRSKS